MKSDTDLIDDGTDASLHYFKKNTLHYLLDLNVLRFMEDPKGLECIVELTPNFKNLYHKYISSDINTMGKYLKDGFAEIIKETNSPAYAAGLYPAPYIQFDLKDENTNTHWQNKLFSLLFEKGIFPSERWFINYSHQQRDITETLDKVREAFKELK